MKNVNQHPTLFGTAMTNVSKIFAFVLLFFACNNLHAANYYWVGGTGNWNDVTHWATTSGGTTFQVNPPTPADDVYFDASSFTVLGQVYFPAGEIFCGSLNCTSLSQQLTFVVDSTIFNCMGDFVLNPNVNFVFTLSPNAVLQIVISTLNTNTIVNLAGGSHTCNHF